MKRILAAAAVMSALALAPQAQAATIVTSTNISNVCGGVPYFCIINGATPFSPLIIAQFGNYVAPANPVNSFDDSFTFIIPQDGIGGGSLSTNFNGGANLSITDVIINGISYASSLDISSAGIGLSVNNLPIYNGQPNYIRVLGTGTGAYNGTMTFNAVPEPATWALLLAGFGAVGFAMRRRRETQPKVRFAF